jgi:hypothetical protein
MPKFRLKEDHPAVDVFGPAGNSNSMPVAPGETVTVPGKVLSENDDVVVTGTDTNDARGWALAVWELIPENTSEPVAPASTSKEA